MGQPLRTNVFQ